MEILQLHSSHNKKEFSCGKLQLDNYIHFQATQDVKKMLAACFVLVNNQNTVLGYYTLSNSGIPKDTIPFEFQKRIPNSYTNLPATLLGRLAIDKSISGKGMGELLLLDALKRCYYVSKSEIGSMAVIIDPIDDNAILFYKKYGFILLPDSGKMFIAMKTITQLITNK